MQQVVFLFICFCRGGGSKTQFLNLYANLLPSIPTTTTTGPPAPRRARRQAARARDRNASTHGSDFASGRFSAFEGTSFRLFNCDRVGLRGRVDLEFTARPRVLVDLRGVRRVPTTRDEVPREIAAVRPQESRGRDAPALRSRGQVPRRRLGRSGRAGRGRARAGEAEGRRPGGAPADRPFEQVRWRFCRLRAPEAEVVVP